MKNIKQTLSEELNKMQFLLGYQRGMVISEQQLIREYDPNVAGTAAPKPSIRSIIEADIKKENLGLTLVQLDKVLKINYYIRLGEVDGDQVKKFRLNSKLQHISKKLLMGEQQLLQLR